MMDEAREIEITAYLNQLEHAIRLRAGKRGLLWLEPEEKELLEELSFLAEWDFTPRPKGGTPQGQGQETLDPNLKKSQNQNFNQGFHPSLNKECEEPPVVARESHPFLELAPKILPKSLEPEVIPPEHQRITAETSKVEQPKLDPLEAQSLDSLHIRMKNCRVCDLCHERRGVVFGIGNQNARLMMIGDFPTEEADKSGKPFSDKGGKLLTQIISSLGINRDSVYLCNVIKCRPPGDRKPHKKEIESCKGYLYKQIELVQPDLIMALGNIATEALLKQGSQQGSLKITEMRGKLAEFNGRAVLPTFHPSYLIHKPEALSLVWEDIRFARKLLFAQKTVKKNN